MRCTKKILFFFIVFCIILINIYRFVDLQKVPNGFYRDESGGASHVVCLVNQGVDAFGKSYPLFSRAYGGYSTPVFLYSTVLWTSVFGFTVESFRSVIGVWSVLEIIGIGLIAYVLWGTEVSLVSLFLASINPWLWVSSRVSWDPPIMPALVVFAFLFLILYMKRGGQRIMLVISALFFALSMYSYLPARAVVPIIIIIFSILLLVKKGKREVNSILVLITSVILFLLPLLHFIFFVPGANDRIKHVYIGSHHFVDSSISNRLIGLSMIALENIGKHFSYTFLVEKGDGNLRHSTGAYGVLSWTEVLLLCCATLLYFVSDIRRRVDKKREIPDENKKNQDHVWICCSLISLIVLFVIPSALTDDGQPHALRSIGSMPFWILLSTFSYQYVMSMLQKNKKEIAQLVLQVLLLIVSLFYLHSFHTYYWNSYARESRNWFDYTATKEAKMNKINVFENYTAFVPGTVSYEELWNNFFKKNSDATFLSKEYFQYVYMNQLECGRRK